MERIFVGSSPTHAGLWFFPWTWRVRLVTPQTQGGFGGRFVREAEPQEVEAFRSIADGFAGPLSASKVLSAVKARSESSEGSDPSGSCHSQNAEVAVPGSQPEGACGSVTPEGFGPTDKPAWSEDMTHNGATEVLKLEAKPAKKKRQNRTSKPRGS